MNVFIVILAYLVGSVPSALIIGKFFYKGVDVRNVGSGNLGTTNMLRSLGIRAAIATAAFDVFIKGSLVTGIALILYNYGHITIMPLFIGMVSAIGHAFPIFAHFKGGKCVATTIGVMVPIHFFVALLVAIILFGTLYYIKKMVISSFIALATGFIIIGIMDNFNTKQIIITVIYYLFVLYLHRSNIKRLINNEEKEIDLKQIVSERINNKKKKVQ